MVITKITNAVGLKRPLCEHQLVSHSSWGDRRRQREGLPLNVCHRPSFYLVDGVPMCGAHAGQDALAHLLCQEVERS